MRADSATPHRAGRELGPVSDQESMSEQETGSSNQARAISPAWSRVERARHPQRPYPMDYIERIFTDFSEIHGDRAYGDDEAVASGMARAVGVSRARRRRARPGRSDRTESARDGAVEGADDLIDYGRRRIGRGAGAGGERPSSNSRECAVLCDF